MGVFFLAIPRKSFLVDVVEKEMEMVTYSGVYFSPHLSPVSMSGIFLSLPLMSLNRSNWPRCLLWHGWWPGLSGVSDKDPWASCLMILERCMGAYPVDHSWFLDSPDYLGC